MQNWMTPDICTQIGDICALMASDDFATLVKRDCFETSSAEGVKAALLQMLGGDILDARHLARIQRPDSEYLANRAEVYEVQQKQAPFDQYRKIELNLIVDGAESDITVVFHVRRDDAVWKVRIYDALVL